MCCESQACQSIETGQREFYANRSDNEKPYRPIIDQAVAQVFSVNRIELSRSTRGQANVALARQVAMYIAHVACGLTFTEIGRMFARDRTTVAHACNVVEDRRDDRIFDAVMELLECAVRNMLNIKPVHDDAN